MKTATQPEKLKSIHGAVAMATRVLMEDSGYTEGSTGRVLRRDQIVILREDGSVWTMELLMPQGSAGCPFRSYAWSLERDLRGLVKDRSWKRVR